MEAQKLAQEVEEASTSLEALVQTHVKAQAEVQKSTQILSQTQGMLTERAKERSSLQKNVSMGEADVAKLDAERDEILHAAALEGLDLPRKSDNTLDFSKVAHSRRRESDILGQLAEVKKQAESLTSHPRAESRYAEASERVIVSEANLVSAREEAAQAEAAFLALKKARNQAFMSMFSHVSKEIDAVYKELTKRANAPLGGSAFLALEADEEEGFVAGIKFECMPPNKRYRAMEHLSGGEKTIAALALLFAIHSFRPSPFFVLDEVDAALDNDNVDRVSRFLSKRSRQSLSGSVEPHFQCLVISLKDALYSKAESLVGVYRDVREDSSKALTLNLAAYDEGEE